MKKTTKKGASKTASKTGITNLQVKPPKGETVRGGFGASNPANKKWIQI